MHFINNVVRYCTIPIAISLNFGGLEKESNNLIDAVNGTHTNTENIASISENIASYYGSDQSGANYHFHWRLFCLILFCLFMLFYLGAKNVFQKLLNVFGTIIYS